jgi:hypothetical protein
MAPDEDRAQTPSDRPPKAITGTMVVLVLALASAAYAQTGAHAFAVAGRSFEGCGDCPPGPREEGFFLIGGGYAFPLIKGRLWIAGDLTSRTSGGYFDASGGPSAVIGLAPGWRERVELFVEAGPRWGDGGNVWGNVGAGIHAWLSPRLGVRVEYQYQWTNVKFFDATVGPGGVIEGTDVDVTEYEHLIRVGFAFRAAPSSRR